MQRLSTVRAGAKPILELLALAPELTFQSWPVQSRDGQELLHLFAEPLPHAFS